MVTVSLNVSHFTHVSFPDRLTYVKLHLCGLFVKVLLSNHLRRKAWANFARAHIHRRHPWRMKTVPMLVKGNHSKSQKLNESNLNTYSLHVNSECVESVNLSVKRVANQCHISQIPALGFGSDNLQVVCTSVASNVCKRTLWKKNPYGTQPHTHI